MATDYKPLTVRRDICETIEVYISPSNHPEAFTRKVECLKLSGMSEQEARETVSKVPVIMEIMYDVGVGLVVVESDAVDATMPIYNPYTGEEIPKEDSV